MSVKGLTSQLKTNTRIELTEPEAKEYVRIFKVAYPSIRKDNMMSTGEKIQKYCRPITVVSKFCKI